jgi:hypothetical protein
MSGNMNRSVYSRTMAKIPAGEFTYRVHCDYSRLRQNCGLDGRKHNAAILAVDSMNITV